MSDTKKNDTRKQRLQRIVDLLKFVLTLEDEELFRSSVESVIDLLEDEIK